MNGRCTSQAQGPSRLRLLSFEQLDSCHQAPPKRWRCPLCGPILLRVSLEYVLCNCARPHLRRFSCRPPQKEELMPTLSEAEDNARSIVNKFTLGAVGASFVPGSTLILVGADALMVKDWLWAAFLLTYVPSTGPLRIRSAKNSTWIAPLVNMPMVLAVFLSLRK